MTSKLYTFYKGAIDFIMPAGSSIDEHPSQVGETRADPGRTLYQPKTHRSDYGRGDEGQDVDSSSSLTAIGKRGIEEGGRSIRHKSSRKVVEDKGTSRPSSTYTSAFYIKDHTKKRKTAAQETAKELARDIEALTEQLRSSQKELVDANLKLTNAEKKISTLEREKHSFVNQYKTAEQAHVERLKAEQGRVADLEARNRKQEGELRVVREKLSATEEKNHSLNRLLEERAADFKGTQAFMTTADLYSGAEIMSMVDTLNAEIFQIAAFTAELVESEAPFATPEERASNIKRFGAILDSAERRLGPELSSHLMNKYADVQSDPLPLQLAIQALLSYECMLEIRTFSYSQFGEAMDRLYKLIKSSEAPAVAGRWRAITNSKMRASRDYSRVDIVLNMILGLLCVCGLSSANFQSNRKIATLKKMLHTLLDKLQMDLKTAVMEGITTADMEVLHVGHGAKPSVSFEDIYAEPVDRVKRPGLMTNGATDQRVLCTVGLGLRKSVTRISPNGGSKEHADVLLRPKVVLTSVLHDVEAEGESHRQGQDSR